MTMKEAVASIRATVKDLNGEFPDLKLSLGYVGNCSMGGVPYDDRYWSVDAKALDKFNYSVSYGLGNATKTDSDKWTRWAENFADCGPSWAAEAARQIDNGTYRIRR